MAKEQNKEEKEESRKKNLLSKRRHMPTRQHSRKKHNV